MNYFKYKRTDSSLFVKSALLNTNCLNTDGNEVVEAILYLGDSAAVVYGFQNFIALIAGSNAREVYAISKERKTVSTCTRAYFAISEDTVTRHDPPDPYSGRDEYRSLSPCSLCLIK